MTSSERCLLRAGLKQSFCLACSCVQEYVSSATNDVIYRLSNAGRPFPTRGVKTGDLASGLWIHRDEGPKEERYDVLSSRIPAVATRSSARQEISHRGKREEARQTSSRRSRRRRSDYTGHDRCRHQKRNASLSPDPKFRGIRKSSLNTDLALVFAMSGAPSSPHQSWSGEPGKTLLERGVLY